MIIDALSKYSVSFFYCFGSFALACNFHVFVSVYMCVSHFSCDSLVKVTCEASSSKSKTIDHFLAMGFEEEKVIKAIHEHGNLLSLSLSLFS